MLLLMRLRRLPLGVVHYRVRTRGVGWRSWWVWCCGGSPPVAARAGWRSRRCRASGDAGADGGRRHRGVRPEGSPRPGPHRGPPRSRAGFGGPGRASGADFADPGACAADGSGELPVPSYEEFTGTEVMVRMALERMLAGLSTRHYPVGLEPVGEQVEAAASSTSKSAVSRKFVRATETALAELLVAGLSGLESGGADDRRGALRRALLREKVRRAADRLRDREPLTASSREALVDLLDHLAGDARELVPTTVGSPGVARASRRAGAPPGGARPAAPERRRRSPAATAMITCRTRSSACR